MHPYEKFQEYPEKFVRDVLGVNLTRDQEIVCEGFKVRDRISVKSGHGVGKSCLAGCMALWFKYTYWPSIVITTAPTERQVKEILWREIRYRKSAALLPLEGKALKMSMELGPIDYMLGISTNDVQQMQGFHGPNIMLIVDEANGYPEDMFDALEGLISGGKRIVLFMIGNPIEPSGRFFNSFSDGDTWTHTISCLDHPNVKSRDKTIIPGAVTYEWVEKQRRMWGTDSAFWYGRVLGEFPRTTTNMVINLWWIENAEKLKYKRDCKESAPYMGADVGEYGDDDYVWFVGTNRRKIHIEEHRNIEPAECIGITKRLKKKYHVPDANITIDGIGAGATVYSVLRQDGVKCNRFVASNTAKDDKTYEDKSTEAWFHIKTLVNPEDEHYLGYSFGGPVEKVKADLCTRKFRTSRYGRLMLEPKEEYRKRLKRSPNFGDAMALCYSPTVARKSYGYIILPDVIGG